MEKIEKYHACVAHPGKACYVQGDGAHYHYTAQDLATWAFLLVCVMHIIDSGLIRTRS